MNRSTKVRETLAAVRRHPARAAAIGVPLLVAASVLAGTTMASAGPEPTLAVPAGALSAAPAQHVMLFDNNLPSAAPAARPSWLTPKVAWNARRLRPRLRDAFNVCVPWTIPGGDAPGQVRTWLTSNGFTDLEGARHGPPGPPRGRPGLRMRVGRVTR